MSEKQIGKSFFRPQSGSILMGIKQISSLHLFFSFIYHMFCVFSRIVFLFLFCFYALLLEMNAISRNFVFIYLFIVLFIILFVQRIKARINRN